MKWLLIAIILFTQQPAKTPQHKSISKSNTESTRSAKAVKKDHTQPEQPTPVASQTPIGHRNATTAGDHPQQSNRKTSDEDHSNQREVTWFTGVLAAVGVLQLVVMLLTWMVYRRQAREMRRQRHEMRRQRHVMLQQWAAMRRQADLMDAQLKAMEESSKQVNKQIEVLERSVDAAEKNAAAAVQNIELYINKERARLRVEMKPLSVPDKPDPAYTIDFTVSIHGPTAAFITESLCVAYIFPWEIVDYPDLGEAVMFPIHSLPAVIPANSPPLNCYAFFALSNADLNIPEVRADRMFVGVRGFVKYTDVFGRERGTNFRYHWKYAGGGLAPLGEYGDWIKSGRPEENRET